jgi:hypothetical protein
MQNVHALPAGISLSALVIARFQIVQGYYQQGWASQV